MARIMHGDLVVVVPGILGSTLYRGRHQIWGYRQVVRSLHSLGVRLTEDLSLPPEAFYDPDRGHDDGVTAPALLVTRGILPGLMTIDGYDELLTALRTRFHEDLADDREAIVEFPYDWRLSNEYTARLLQQRVEPLIRRRRRRYPDARIVFIAHSMGGLVSRYYAHVLDERCYTRRIVTIGTPYQGAVKALTALANGYAQLGPFTVGLAELVRSLPSVAELLPVYPCLGAATGTLARLADTSVPGLPANARLRCLDFHNGLQRAMVDHPDRRPKYHAILSHRQATDVWASVADTPPAHPGAPSVIAHQPRDFADRGDGTVPRCSATPPEWDDDAYAHFLAGRHAALQQTVETYRQLTGILTARPRHRAAEIDEIAADVPELAAPGQPWTVKTSSVEGSGRLVLSLTVTEDTGAPVTACPLRPTGNGGYIAEVTLTKPGLYRWTISAPPTASTPVDPLTDLVLVAHE